eukprot:12205695-Alexandrium_andersonii.AAC.1
MTGRPPTLPTRALHISKSRRPRREVQMQLRCTLSLSRTRCARLVCTAENSSCVCEHRVAPTSSGPGPVA